MLIVEIVEILLLIVKNLENLENPAHIVKILLGFPVVPPAYSSSCQRDNLSGWEFVKVFKGSIRPADLKTLYARGIP